MTFFSTSNLQFINESSNKMNSVFRKDSSSSPMFLIHSHYVVHCSFFADRLNQEVPIVSLGQTKNITLNTSAENLGLQAN